MATTQHHARIIWEGDKQDVQAHRIELAEQTVAASAWDGDGAKADPEELLVGAVSSCHMLWFIALARGAKLRVTSYEDEAEGTMDGTRITRVVLRPRVALDPEPSPERLAELHEEAHARCYIANTVNCPVEVEPAT